MKHILVIIFLILNNMPGSRINGKQEIKAWVEGRDDIKTIVDVGCGSGTYAKLLGKNYKYIGIDIWEPYVSMFGLKSLYDEIIIADIRDCSPLEGDLIIFGDILEHLPKKDALRVLEEAKKQYKHLIVSIPISLNQDEIVPGKIHYGNPNEAHISAWTFAELEKMYNWDKIIYSGEIGVFIK